jgi:hypothetical protein
MSQSWNAHAEELGLRVETASPDALCPELSATRDAVTRRLGALVVPDGEGWLARYTIGHTPQGQPRDFVRLELIGPDGATALSRDLPLEAGACGTMAEVIALVLDRYFRALQGQQATTPEAERPEAPASPTATPAPQPPSPAAVAPANETVSSLPPAAPTPPWVLGVELGGDQDGSVRLGGRSALRPSPHVLAGLELSVALGSKRESLSDAAAVTSRSADLRAWLAWVARVGAVEAYVGPDLGFSFERATAQGLPVHDVGYRALGFAGVSAGVSWAAGELWVLSLCGALDATAPSLGGRFFVEEAEVLKPDTLRGWLGLGVGWRL